MPRTIEQAVTFRTTPERLYRLYLSSRQHAAACGGWGTAKIQARKGGRMQMAPHITGKFLSLVPGKLIVQTWRGSDWKRSDLDSVLILSFSRRFTLTSPTLTREASRRAGTRTTGTVEEIPQKTPRLIRRGDREA